MAQYNILISESQERMACVITKENELAFKEAVAKENLEASTVAEIKEEKRVKIYWRGKTIINISRVFLDSNGATKKSKVKITEPSLQRYFRMPPQYDCSCNAPSRSPA